MRNGFPLHAMFRYAFALLAPVLTVSAQPPPGYYDSAQGLTGEALRAALNEIISPHSVLAYSQLWSAFARTDRRPDGSVWDIYSDVPGGTLPYSYQFVSDQCGTYNGEGDCFNREHSFPVSWFNDALPMNTDLNHIFPTDAWVNQQRGNLPYGTVASASWTSQNGGKRGPCSWPDCSGTVFEPIDPYKGDLARGHLYMLTRYLNESANWPAPILSTGEFLPWAESVLLAWHTLDPVSDKERARNDSVYVIQGNRNPYIDHPEWVTSIWGPEAGLGEMARLQAHVQVIDDELVITSSYELTQSAASIIDATGREILRVSMMPGRVSIPFPFPSGVYLLRPQSVPGAVRFVR
jgi:endonuclease I